MASITMATRVLWRPMGEKKEVVKLRPDIWERVIGYRDNHHANQARPEALSYGLLSQEDVGVRNIEHDPLCS